MKHLAVKIPYLGTKISPEITQAKIIQMLNEFGVKGQRWTSEEGKPPCLEFLLTVEVNGLEKRFGVRINVPQIMIKKRVKFQGIINTVDEAVSMRLLFWFLKGKLEAIRFGIEDSFNCFFSQAIMAIADDAGNISNPTMGELAKKNPKALNNLIPSFTIGEPDKQLEDKS